jgi:hypothetical protein
MASGTIFTALHLLHNLRMGPIYNTLDQKENNLAY